MLGIKDATVNKTEKALMEIMLMEIIFFINTEASERNKPLVNDVIANHDGFCMEDSRERMR